MPPLRELRRVLRPDGHLVVSTQHPTADWLRKGGSYFDHVLETDIWKGADWDHDVRFWRAPLTFLCEAFIEAGFVIDRLVEHQPSAEFAEVDPEGFKDLTGRPGFIAFRLQPSSEAETPTGKGAPIT